MYEKEIKMTPTEEKAVYNKFGFVITEYHKHICPRCASVLNAGPNYQPKYCPECGQHLDWENIEFKPEKELGYVKTAQEIELGIA